MYFLTQSIWVLNMSHYSEDEGNGGYKTELVTCNGPIFYKIHLANVCVCSLLLKSPSVASLLALSRCRSL